MGLERKDKLLSFRIPESDYDYVCSSAEEKKITISEFIRIAIEKTKPGNNAPTRGEVVAYLKKLAASQRDGILDRVENAQKRKIRSFIDGAICREPGIKGKKLVEMVSKELGLPTTLDLKHKIYLRIKSVRRRKKLVGNLEKKY